MLKVGYAYEYELIKRHFIARSHSVLLSVLLRFDSTSPNQKSLPPWAFLEATRHIRHVVFPFEQLDKIYGGRQYRQSIKSRSVIPGDTDH